VPMNWQKTEIHVLFQCNAYRNTGNAALAVRAGDETGDAFQVCSLANVRFVCRVLQTALRADARLS
jgi:hypothetical protein